MREVVKYEVVGEIYSGRNTSPGSGHKGDGFELWEYAIMKIEGEDRWLLGYHMVGEAIPKWKPLNHIRFDTYSEAIKRFSHLRTSQKLVEIDAPDGWGDEQVEDTLGDEWGEESQDG